MFGVNPSIPFSTMRFGIRPRELLPMLERFRRRLDEP